MVVKQQYNAANRTWKTFPDYEAKLRVQLNNILGSIIYEDEHAFVFNGRQPCFTNIGRKVLIARCFKAGKDAPTTLFDHVKCVDD
jgi:hypothetical protein